MQFTALNCVGPYAPFSAHLILVAIAQGVYLLLVFGPNNNSNNETSSACSVSCSFQTSYGQPAYHFIHVTERSCFTFSSVGSAGVTN